MAARKRATKLTPILPGEVLLADGPEGGVGEVVRRDPVEH